MAAPQRDDAASNERSDFVAANTEDANITRRRIAGGDLGVRNIKTQNVRTPVRTSKMPGSPQNTPFTSDKRDIATNFNASYAKKGIQPSFAANDANPDDAANDPNYAQPYQQPEQITRSKQTQEIAEQKRQAATTKTSTPRRRKQRGGRVKKKLSIATQAFAKIRVSAVNAWIFSWGTFIWICIQIPLAIGSLLFFGLEYMVQSFGGAKTSAAEVAFGIDFGSISMIGIGMMLHGIVMLIGWFILMLMFFIYKTNRLEPLGGRGSSTKYGMLLLAYIGYTLPIVNLIPWFIFWAVAVWWSPK